MKSYAGEASPQAVRAQMAAYLAECEKDGTEPVSETFRFYLIMEDRVKPGIEDLNVWSQPRARERFCGQVLRELNLLAANGTLVKRGERKNLHFYTPAAAKALDEREEKRRAARVADAQRTQGVRRRLEALGVEPRVGIFGGGIDLDLTDWEILVRLAEKGRRP